MEDKIKLIITDDKERYRSAIRRLLEPCAVEVIGEAENGKKLLALLNKKHPDIILLDLEMPVMDGNQAFEIIRKEFPEIKVIVLSYYSESVLMEDYMQRGVKGYIPKDAIEQQLLMKALNIVKDGGVFIYDKPSNNKTFTYRQKEILPWIFDGLTNEQIAEKVCISKRAVEKQRHKIYERSGVQKAVDFYKYAFTRGLQFLGKHKR